MPPVDAKERAPILQVILLPFALPEICGWGEFPMPQSNSENSGKYHLDATHVFKSFFLSTRDLSPTQIQLFWLFFRKLSALSFL